MPSTSSIFRQRLVRVPLELDYPYWVDDENFDVDLVREVGEFDHSDAFVSWVGGGFEPMTQTAELRKSIP